MTVDLLHFLSLGEQNQEFAPIFYEYMKVLDAYLILKNVLTISRYLDMALAS